MAANHWRGDRVGRCGISYWPIKRRIGRGISQSQSGIAMCQRVSHGSLSLSTPSDLGCMRVRWPRHEDDQGRSSLPLDAMLALALYRGVYSSSSEALTASNYDRKSVDNNGWLQLGVEGGWCPGPDAHSVLASNQPIDALQHGIFSECRVRRRPVGPKKHKFPGLCPP